MLRKMALNVLKVVTVLVTLGIGIHFLNCEVRAEDTYSVQMLDWQGLDQYVPINGLLVEMKFDYGSGFGDWITADNLVTAGTQFRL
ncbi:hypothetical protein K9N50_11895 [bacterium]|nr:hypothetical protein [bacterium]